MVYMEKEQRKEPIGKVLKRLREQRGLSQRKLAQISGLDREHIVQIEGGKTKTMRLNTAEALASGLGVSVEVFCASGSAAVDRAPPRAVEAILQELLQRVGAMEVVEVPCVGSVPAGWPDLREQEAWEHVSIPLELVKGCKTDNLFALKVSGQSLEGDGIRDGDTVIVKRDAMMVDGKVYIVRLGNEVVARHVYWLGDKVKLAASNSDYQEIEASEVEILGRVILAGQWQRL